MTHDCISYADTGYFSPLILDYLAQKPELKSLYHRFPELESFAAQMAEKKRNYPEANRRTLVSTLQKQYAKLDLTDAVKQNIAALADADTFTVTTGHQLNLFSGPLYFLYKIISTINLARELGQRYPNKKVVPVYWMATEDHDFEEIDYFHFRGRKFVWNHASGGPVGRMDTQGLDEVAAVFAAELGVGQRATFIANLFEKAYLAHDNLADATRYLAHELFKDYGLVILDADDRALKTLFVPYIERELTEQFSFAKTRETIGKMDGYGVQVNPREINLFYMEDSFRERIVAADDGFAVHGMQNRFTREALLERLQSHPENFSPNVILRPLYQEVVLPNLAYIGGGGEIAYWLELKAVFDAAGVTFPMLMLRNSVLLVSEKQAGKAERLGVSIAQLFEKTDALLRAYTRQISSAPLDFTALKSQLAQQFDQMWQAAESTDRSFSGAVKAQQAKQLKGLDNLERKLLRAEQRKHADQLERLRELRDALFPGGGLQERRDNFSAFYLEMGDDLIETLVRELKPLEFQFLILSYK